MPIPGPKGLIRRIYESTIAHDWALAIAALVSSLYTAYNQLNSDRQGGRFAISVAIVVFLLSSAKLLRLIRKELQEQALHDLEGCLYTLYSVLLADHPRGEGLAGLRLTIHVPIDRGTRLQQVLPYVGDDRGGKKTSERIFSVNCGIIGKAYREAEHLVVASRVNDNHESYIKELVQNWSYTETDARRLDPATMAWLAVPLHNEQTGEVEGILYADSTDRDFFDENRQILALWGAVGIAIYVGRRYSEKGAAHA